MGMLQPGEMIYFRVMPDTKQYHGKIVSSSKETLLLEHPADTPPTIDKGRHIIVSGEHFDYFTEVLTNEGAGILLKKLWEEKRGYFRVDDVFPVRYQRVTENVPLKKSTVLSQDVIEMSDTDLPDGTVSPKLWKMLDSMNAKLNMILERLNLESAGLTTAENKMVNVSATGIRMSLQDRSDIGDIYEIKMLLPTTPPVGIETYGRVVRARDIGNGEYEVGLQFIEMEDDVRDEIIRYTLKRQREVMLKERQQRGNNG
ncbi:MAG: PilZ domain-containing protein [Thermodesulfovibrionales bacterium]|jgi:hypothetical protein